MRKPNSGFPHYCHAIHSYTNECHFFNQYFDVKTISHDNELHFTIIHTLTLTAITFIRVFFELDCIVSAFETSGTVPFGYQRFELSLMATYILNFIAPVAGFSSPSYLEQVLNF